MNMQIEGGETGKLLVATLYLAARMGPLFVLSSTLLSLGISIVALRKRLIGLSILFLIIPLSLVASWVFWFLSMTSGRDYGIVNYISSTILSLSMLSPFIVSLLVIKRLSKKSANKSMELTRDEVQN